LTLTIFETQRKRSWFILLRRNESNYLQLRWRFSNSGDEHDQLIVDTEITESVAFSHEYQLTQSRDDVIEGHVIAMSAVGVVGADQCVNLAR